jgi:hypothetical protein
MPREKHELCPEYNAARCEPVAAGQPTWSRPDHRRQGRGHPRRGERLRTKFLSSHFASRSRVRAAEPSCARKSLRRSRARQLHRGRNNQALMPCRAARAGHLRSEAPAEPCLSLNCPSIARVACGLPGPTDGSRKPLVLPGEP